MFNLSTFNPYHTSMNLKLKIFCSETTFSELFSSKGFFICNSMVLIVKTASINKETHLQKVQWME